MLIGLTVSAGCSVAGDLTPTQESPTVGLAAPASATTEFPREVISLGISLYLLVEDNGEPNSEISTRRTERDLREILDGMNAIWSQADIRLKLQTIETLEVPEAILQRMLAGNLGPFFSQLGGGITIPQPAAINGFYLRRVGGPNGINPSRSSTFFVIDEPSVFDRRVSSHEVGHILGLIHVLDDSERLLYSGTNGMTLTDEEATVARYFAQGIIDGVR